MKIFLKANLSSIIASFCDYLLTIIFKEFLQYDAVLASIMGTIFGGSINFLIGRYWVFKSFNTHWFDQVRRYLFTWAGNLGLNAFGVFLLIRFCGVNYIIAKVAISLTVALVYNYPIQKKYVFKKY